MAKKTKELTQEYVFQVTNDLDSFVGKMFNELRSNQFPNYGMHIRTFIEKPDVIIRGTSFCLSPEANAVVLNELLIDQREAYKAFQIHLRDKADDINTIIEILNDMIDEKENS